jgi:hypothetical protein
MLRSNYATFKGVPCMSRHRWEKYEMCNFAIHAAAVVMRIETTFYTEFECACFMERKNNWEQAFYCV